MNKQPTVDTYLKSLGINLRGAVYHGLTSAEHAEQAIRRMEGQFSDTGALVVNTGSHTGRSPNDKYIVQEESLSDIWWGKVNQPLSKDNYQVLLNSITSYLGENDLFIDDVNIGKDQNHRLAVRVVSSHAWYGLFCRNLFIPSNTDRLSPSEPSVTILHAPEFSIRPEMAGLRSSTFIVLNLTKRIILIGGTAYAGEVKKSVFSLMNYLMPKEQVLPMHCSANVGAEGDVALFFGLSGTGKTTLSSSPDRQLIGDDEHGWSPEGIFNFEGGCYAKTIRLKAEFEPLIWNAVHRFGAVLENVVIDSESRAIDFDSDKITENTRAAYPLNFIDNYFSGESAGHPKNIFFLTADASGVLPPIAHLTPDQAMYYFLAGYTSKLAGTEVNLGSQPQATFSACFAAPFLPLHPMVYAGMLGDLIHQHQTNIWLVNTGWSGGMFGVGKRIHLPFTRAMIKAALESKLSEKPFIRESYFNLQIPNECPGVPAEILNPKLLWSDTSAYDAQAKKLADKFMETMIHYQDQIPSAVIQAGPKV